MDLDADVRNIANAEDSSESGDGDYGVVSFEVQILTTTWDTIASSTTDAATFVSWLESKRTP